MEGKEVLLKLVAQATPTYSMSLFKILVQMVKDINMVMANFWWGRDENKWKTH